MLGLGKLGESDSLDFYDFYGVMGSRITFAVDCSFKRFCIEDFKGITFDTSPSVLFG